MNIYEINQAIMSCIDFDSGEVIDLEKLQELQMEKEQKIENVACWIKNLAAESAAIKDEISNLQDRMKANEKKAESLKGYLNYALEGEKFHTAKVAVSWRKSEQVNVVDEAIIPKKYLVKTVSVKPDKTAIKDLLKQGKTVKGCELLLKYNAQIK